MEAFSLDAGTQPLFTGRARRQAVVKALVSTGLMGSFSGDFGFGARLGLRLRNLWEFGVLVERLSLTGLGPDRLERPAFGLAMGMHVDGDGDPRWAFTFGLEGGGNPGDGGFTFLTLKWGPRLGLGSSLFVTASPLELTFLGAPDGTLGRATRLTASVEMGATW